MMSRWIDAEWLKQNFNTVFWSQITKIIDSAPSIEIVCCGECKYGEYREDFDDYECHASGCGLVHDADFYCADGERNSE